MSKRIDTLVEDIQDLFRKPHQSDGRRVEALSKALGETISRRLQEERGPSYLRMSNLGKGDRQLWYEINKPELNNEPLTPSTKIKFLFGDILELLLLFLAEEAGHEVVDQNRTVEVNGVKGSIDAVIDGVLVDTKSASTHAFKKFDKHTLPDDDPFGYMEQLAGYSKGLGDPDGAFLVIGKEMGHITLDQHSADELSSYRIEDRIAHIKDAVASDVVPERCYPDKEYGKGGNRVLGTNCSYCPFKQACWEDVNNGVGLRTFSYAGGPVHFTHIEKEPEVMEFFPKREVVV